MPTELASLEIVTRNLRLNNQPAKPIRGCTPRDLRKALAECEQDAAVVFAVILPNGHVMYTGVQAILTDIDGTGNGVMLGCNNVAKRLGGVG